MRNIRGIDKAVDILSPHWQEIDEYFNAENKKFTELLQTDHRNIGRIIKCHLILELYIERYLCKRLNLTDISDLRLTFYQKVLLLPETSAAITILKSDLLLLNKFRNRIAHDLNLEVSMNELNSMIKILEISGRNTENMDVYDVIDSFTTLACTWLLITPPHLEELFNKAFGEVEFVAELEIQ